MGDIDAAVDPEATATVSAEHKGSFSSFIKTLVSFSGDLSQLTAPSYMLNGLSLLDYSTHWGDYPDMFERIAEASTPEERMMRVLSWFISTLYGSYHARCKNGQEKKPFNPILGEQMFCYWDNGNSMSVEQVCHHPPITALYLESKKARVCLNGQCGQKTKFKTGSIAVQQTGEARLALETHNETYITNLPDLYVRGLLSGSIFLELSGAIKIECNNGWIAEIDFVGKPWIGGDYHTLKGKVYHTSDPRTYLCGLTGKWTEIVHFTRPDLKTVGDVCFSVKDNKAPSRKTKPVEEQSELESEKIWGKCAKALAASDYGTASKEKQTIEDEQRKLRKDREAQGIQWEPKMFKSIRTDKEHPNGLWEFKESLVPSR